MYHKIMNIYFIRHGDPDYVTDSLTETGHIQAKKLAETIEELKLDEIYQSPMGRARQTASYSAQKLGMEPVTLPWLEEICWGDMSGDAYSTESPWSLSDKFIFEDHAYPQGDSWKEHPLVKNDRLVQSLEEHVSSLDAFLADKGYVREGQLYRSEAGRETKNIGVFCHGGVIAACASHLLNIPFFQFIAHTTIGFTSITKIALSDKTEYKAGKLIYFNDCRHLNER